LFATKKVGTGTAFVTSVVCVVKRRETTMTNAASFKIAGVFATFTLLAVMFGASDALTGFTHFFNLTAVGIFAVASTLGLATRLRA
jgi:hypothetical protein